MRYGAVVLSPVSVLFINANSRQTRSTLQALDPRSPSLLWQLFDLWIDLRANACGQWILVIKAHSTLAVTEYLAMPRICSWTIGVFYAAMSAMSDRVTVLGRERFRLYSMPYQKHWVENSSVLRRRRATCRERTEQVDFDT